MEGSEIHRPTAFGSEKNKIETKPLGRPRGRRENDTETDLREVDCWEGVDWIQLAQTGSNRVPKEQAVS
jgi:hypothetical protein